MEEDKSDCLEALEKKVEELKLLGFSEEEIKGAMLEWRDNVWYRDW